MLGGAEITVEWFRDLIAQIQSDLANAALDRASAALIGYVAQTAPRQTGALASSFIKTPNTKSGNGWNCLVESNLDYAWFQHSGVRPFEPRNARALAWMGPSGMVFSQRSSGFPANDYFIRACTMVTSADWGL